MKNINHSFVRILLILCSPLSVAYAQTAPIDSFVSIHDILTTKQIKDDNYAIINYHYEGGKFTNVTMLRRQVSHDTWEGKNCIKIDEETSGLTHEHTTIFVGATNLLPLHYEFSVNDTLKQKADFDNGMMTLFDLTSKASNNRESKISSDVFFSNSFSELIECIDFDKYPKVRYQTMSPGQSPHQFLVERLKQIPASVSAGKVDCWQLKFTVLDPAGKGRFAGYRYVNKNTRQIMSFKLDLAPNMFVGYERLLFY